MDICLIQLKEKIIQFIKIVFRLAITPMQTQALTTSITKLSPTFGEENPQSSKEDE